LNFSTSGITKPKTINTTSVIGVKRPIRSAFLPKWVGGMDVDIIAGWFVAVVSSVVNDHQEIVSFSFRQYKNLSQSSQRTQRYSYQPFVFFVGFVRDKF
jgi:hypothetical protein